MWVVWCEGEYIGRYSITALARQDAQDAANERRNPAQIFAEVSGGDDVLMCTVEPQDVEVAQ